MAKKKKVRVDRVIILVLGVVLITGILGYGVFALLDVVLNRSNKTPDNAEVITDPQPVETVQGIKMELLSYENYIDDTDKLGFNYIIATFRFSSNSSISFDLDNLQTSQKLHLNNVSKYLSTLEDNGYKISKLNIVNTVVSNENQYECNIFIPYTTEESSIRISNAVDQSMINFDLTQNIHYVSEMKIDTSVKIDVDNTSVNVSSCSVSTMMLHNGQEYEVASTLKVFTFKININSVEGNVMITDAKFVKDGSNIEIPCMSSEYSSVKVDNILGKKLTLGENGALFFETESSEDKPDYSGTLFIMFSNGSDWVKISTSLE